MRDPVLIYLGWLVFAAVGVSLIVAVALVLRRHWTRPSRLRRTFVNASVVCFTLYFLFLGLEISFYFVAVQSDSFGFTLAAKRWFEEHWHPINAFGYRDIEHPRDFLEEKDVLLVVGDSFVAGHGIADPANRFSNVLQGELGPDWVVVNVAKNGWHTRDEYDAIVSYPVEPKLIVLSYYTNDIDHAAQQHGVTPAFPLEEPPPLLRSAVRFSYFFNFVYWRVYRFNKAGEFDRIRSEYLDEIYTSEEIWKTHERELLDIIDYTGSHRIELIVVVFPNLRDIERSKEITSRVVDLMRSRDVPVIDLPTLLADRNPAQLVAGPVDNHPGAALHREVGLLLHEQVMSLIEQESFTTAQ